MTLINQRLALIELGTLSLLLIPYVAMFFSTEVNWKTADFLVAGGLLLVLGLLIELVLRYVNTSKSRVFWIAGVVIVFALIWAQLAVGLL